MPYSLTSDASVKRPPRVVVVGSANGDIVVRVPHLPRPGETVTGGAFAHLPGGKGANQAVAAARLGAAVSFVACVGTDSFGEAAIQGYEAERIDVRHVTRLPETATGVALITVDDATGENSIVLVPGANHGLSVRHITAATEAIQAADVVVCQLESPLPTVLAALRLAHAAGKITILNPAPAQAVPEELLSLVSVLTPNETEAALLAGPAATAPAQWAAALRAQGAASVVLTLGAAGALVVTDAGATAVPSFAPRLVADTTAAGDCFTGALAVALAEGKTLPQAALFAAAAASLSVEIAGAQPSLPGRAAADERMRGE